MQGKVWDLGKAMIGMLFSPSSNDDHEKSDGRKFHSDLEGIGRGCRKVDLDFHEIKKQFNSKKDNSNYNDALYVFVENLVKEQKLDGLIFPGDWYNVLEPNINPSKDRMDVEKALWKVSRNLGIPLLGVCGGFQHVAFFAGADLTNNVKELTGDNHFTKAEEGSNIHPAEKFAHNVITVRGTYLFNEYEKTVVENEVKWRAKVGAVKSELKRVNSIHNQGVKNTENTVAKLKENNLEVAATDNHVQEDGKVRLVEGITSIYGVPVTLVQFHPEYLHTKSIFHQNIIESFITSASAYAAKREANSMISLGAKSHVEAVVKSAHEVGRVM